MDLNWFQAIIYGFFGGFTEFVPVSSQAHQAIMGCLFGADRQNLLRLFVTAGALAGLLFACSGQMGRIRRETRLARLPAKRRKRPPEHRVLLEMKLLRLAAFPMLLGLLFRLKTASWAEDLLLVAVFLLVNGLVLYLPERLPQGNKDARNLSRFDGLLLGIGGALGVIPGLSRMGGMLTAAGIRGTGKQFALEMALLLSIPALVLTFGLELVLLVGTGAAGISVGGIFLCILAGFASVLGTYCAILFMRFLAVKVGFSGFAYYCWGAALFAFILYLIT